jgi:hypothetical protein
MQPTFNRNKSLQELEGEDWGEPTYHSYLVETLHRLHRQPLKAFSVEDLRICILQNIGLPYLMWLAVERLKRYPLAEGDYFPGDLLVAVLQVESTFWAVQPTMVRQVREFLEKVRSLFSLVNDAGSGVIQAALAEAEAVFVERTRQLT